MQVLNGDARRLATRIVAEDDHRDGTNSSVSSGGARQPSPNAIGRPCSAAADDFQLPATNPRRYREAEVGA